MSEPDRPVLAVEGLRVETIVGAEIVDEISFSVLPGEVVALVGESGSGKTTTALALLGHARRGTRIAAGTVKLDGQDLLRLPSATLRRVRGARISYVPQDATSGLNPRQRIHTQLAEALAVHGRDASAVPKLLGRVHLPMDKPFLRRYPFELSGGQQQRVAIAMALACKPLVVVLDEPTTGLDVTTQARVLELLIELSREDRAGFVYVTHDLAVVDGLADRIAVMYAGRVVELGSREQVFGTPAHPYTSSLLASVPRLSAPRRLTGISGTAPPPGSRPVGCFFEPRCPIAVARCQSEFPPNDLVEQGHSVRCWRASVFSAIPSVVPLEETSAHETSLLVVENLTASYGRGQQHVQALRAVSFSIAIGGRVALVGESGSGKTTLGRCVAGLHRPEQGTITLSGVRLAPHATERSRVERQRIQIVFQNPDRSLNPRQTIGRAIGRPLRLFGYASDGPSERAQVAELLERVRLPTSARTHYPSELSGGEKQRAAIARALAARPSLLICDEITSSLDVSIQAAIVALLDELRESESGLALLFITHNLALVNSTADRILVLEGGEVREYGDTSTVISRPSHPYTRELLAAAPDLRVSGVL